MVLQRAIFIQAICTATYIFVIMKTPIAKSSASLQNTATQNAVDIEKACYNFTIGNEDKKEFYSPNYPNNYPSNIKCTKQIHAGVGHVVTLDFRDEFRIEESTPCEYDKLIVRDGPYGYSPILGVFCGKAFPNKISSSGRYLWLQFITDENLECSGFRAVYTFERLNGVEKTQQPEKECAVEKRGYSGIIQISDVEPFLDQFTDSIPIDCMWIIEADHPKKRIYMNFVEFVLKYPNDCEKNVIEVYQKSRIDSHKVAGFCGTTAEPLAVESPMSHVRLFLDISTYNHTKLKVHYTVFREVKKPETCDATEFSCEDGTCIDKSLTCDDVTDCKYNYDEDDKMCKKSATGSVVLTSHHMLIILIVFFALVVAMCVSVSLSCYNKVQDRKVREREYKERRSKEASVDATMDRTIRGHSSPDRGQEPSLSSQLSKPIRSTHRTNYPDDGDDESSDGCYVPEVDISPYQKYPNGGGTIPRRPDGRSVSRGGIQSEMNKQQYPFISQSTDSIESETTVPPAPPPVHSKERREPALQQKQQQAPPTYRFVEGKVIPNADDTPFTQGRFKPLSKYDTNRPSSTVLQRARWPPESKTFSATLPTPIKGYVDPKKGQTDPRNATTRGPLEAGVPRSIFTRNPGDYGLPRFGTAKPNPETTRGVYPPGFKDEVLPLSIFKTPGSYGNPPYRPNAYRGFKPEEKTPPASSHQFRAQAKVETSDRDSSRADSVDSIQSAPDVVAQR